MKKTGMVFPGQGSQYIGMGRDLYDRFDYVREMFATADRVLGFPMTDLCFNGPEDELRQTYNTQPSLLLVGYAVYEVLRREAGVTPFFFAGHSLGEYTALTASGFFTFEEALAITRKRGLLMEEACPKGKGGMVALIGADMDKIAPVLAEISHDDYVAVPANLNSAEQVVLSGDAGALKEAVERLKGTGYKKAVFLNVSGPFHSPLMRAAAERLKSELAALGHGELSAPVVFNVDAAPGKTKGRWTRGSTADVLPVLWEKCVQRWLMGAWSSSSSRPREGPFEPRQEIYFRRPLRERERFEEIESVRGVLA
jgi:[acyl-carrier-protein] S-malonyltransferase